MQALTSYGDLTEPFCLPFPERSRNFMSLMNFDLRKTGTICVPFLLWVLALNLIDLLENPHNTQSCSGISVQALVGARIDWRQRGQAVWNWLVYVFWRQGPMSPYSICILQIDEWTKKRYCQYLTPKGTMPKMTPRSREMLRQTEGSHFCMANLAISLVSA
uniref:Uncharacterized protein n=1 Tax=Solanum lycopersicum TaxID=4081 RepID=A0A3Q7GYF3_SOLLC